MSSRVKECIEKFDIDSPFDIDEKINLAKENALSDDLDTIDELAIQIKDCLYNIDNWELRELYVLFDMDPDEVIVMDEFYEKITPFINDNAPDDLRSFVDKAINRLSIETFGKYWREIETSYNDMKRFDNDDTWVSMSRCICLDSGKRRDLHESIDDCKYDLSDPIRNAYALELVEINIPLTWYTFHSDYGNNYFLISTDKVDTNGSGPDSDPNVQNNRNATIEIDEDCNTTLPDVDYSNYKEIILEDGNYTAQELVDVLNTKVKTELGININIFSYNKNTRKITITTDNNNNNNIHIVFFHSTKMRSTSVQDCLGYYMGFIDVKDSTFEYIFQTYVEAGGSVTAPKMVNTYGTPYVQLCIDEYSNNNMYNYVSSQSNDYILNRIDLNPNSTRDIELKIKVELNSIRPVIAPDMDAFAQIHLSSSPCSASVIADNTPQYISYNGFTSSAFKRIYAGPTNISFLRVQLKNNHNKPLFLQSDFTLILKASFRVKRQTR